VGFRPGPWSGPTRPGPCARPLAPTPPPMHPSSLSHFLFPRSNFPLPLFHLPCPRCCSMDGCRQSSSPEVSSPPLLSLSLSLAAHSLATPLATRPWPRFPSRASLIACAPGRVPWSCPGRAPLAVPLPALARVPPRRPPPPRACGPVPACSPSARSV
jgi:hypothetical protein